MSDHDPEVYRELLSEFRNGYSRYGAPQSVLCLEAMTSDEYDARMEGKFKTAVLGVAGFVPASEDGSKPPWKIVATVAGQMWMESMEAELVRDGYTGPRLDRLASPEIYFAVEREAWEVYEPLIVYAGGHLPAAIRSALACPPFGPPSWWLSTMWYSKPPSQEDLAGPPKQLRVIWPDPFQEAIETIERCGLTTDSPVLVPGQETTPPGVSKPRGEPKVETETDVWLSAPELAKKYRVDGDLLRKRLERWRKQHDADYRETEFTKPREPRFLYRVSAVLPIVEAMQGEGSTSGETGVERASK